MNADRARQHVEEAIKAHEAGHKNFVVFYSPGTLTAETSTRELPSGWDIELAKTLARNIKERHGATPYGFCFVQRARGPDDLDSKETHRSHMYYLGGTVETLAEFKARATHADRILLTNMEINGWDRIITNDNSWRWTQPLKPDDVVLDFTP